ncbi:MAG: 3-oxoacyl-[acyl-carrier-protein] synthase, partial [Pseudomonadota bacterium]|nr:3-oxoacyl-[acyl-carrier-protein] synthase [Pseudomonadota bacterium]
MTFARVAGVGSYLPSNRVLNNDLVARGVDTNDEWIVARTGIRARHLAEAGQTSSDLALIASQRAMEMAGIDAAEID